MPNLNVCTGPAFGTGSSGELVVAGSGSHAWTLAGPIAAGNGLNTDPANGLWTAPHGCYWSYQEQSASSLSQALSGTAFNLPLTNPTYTNPSSVSQMRLRAAMYARAQVTATANSLGQLTAALSFTGAPVTTMNPSVPIPNPVASTVTGMFTTVVKEAEIVVPAAGTATLNPTVSATLLGGGETLTAWVVGFQFWGWLLDPTQAGGI